MGIQAQTWEIRTIHADHMLRVLAQESIVQPMNIESRGIFLSTFDRWDVDLNNR